jgi:hypothetical protein
MFFTFFSKNKCFSLNLGILVTLNTIKDEFIEIFHSKTSIYTST